MVVKEKTQKVFVSMRWFGVTKTRQERYCRGGRNWLEFDDEGRRKTFFSAPVGAQQDGFGGIGGRMFVGVGFTSIGKVAYDIFCGENDARDAGRGGAGGA